MSKRHKREFYLDKARFGNDDESFPDVTLAVKRRLGSMKRVDSFSRPIIEEGGRSSRSESSRTAGPRTAVVLTGEQWLPSPQSQLQPVPTGGGQSGAHAPLPLAGATEGHRLAGGPVGHELPAAPPPLLEGRLPGR